MGSPQQNGQMPAELKAMVDRYIREETARILAAQQPPAAKELTPEEQARLLLFRASQLEAGEKSRPSSSGPTHEAMLALLSILLDKLFPVATEKDEATPILVPSDVVEAGA